MLENEAAHTPTERAYQRFIEAYLAQRNNDAIDIFLEALTADPENAFRHFAVNGGAELPKALVETSRVGEVAARLDPMLAEHPHMHLMCRNDRDMVDALVRLREENIAKGLPSMVVASMRKSASVSIAGIFNSGFNLPTFAYSLFFWEVIESWARDFARGGASYTTHLEPSRETVARLKRAGISRLIVHVRDPRQAFVSMVHHFEKHPDQLIAYPEEIKDAPNLSARAMSVLRFYLSSIRWIRGWLDLEGEIDILFSTFEDFVTDRAGFVQKYLEFYGGDRAHFSSANAFTEHTGVDYHFRRGLADEWREVFSRDEAAYLSSLLPLRAKERFGWWDPEERASGASAGSSSPAHRDRAIAWLKATSEPGDAAAEQEVDRRLAAGQRLPADLEERATRAKLRDYPDQSGMLLRLRNLILNRGGEVPDDFVIHGLRSRLADLSRPPAAGTDPAERERERLDVARQLAILEILEQAQTGGSVSQLLLQGTIKLPDAQGYAKLAHELTRRRDLEGAEAAYLRAIELDSSPSLYRALADVLDAAGRTTEAVDILELLSRQTPGDAELHARLGRLATGQGDFARAEVAYRRAIEVQADAIAHRRHLADVIDAAGRPKEAAEILQSVAAREPGDAELQARLGHVLIRCGDLGGAEAVLRSATATDGVPLGARFDLADVIAARGRPAEAIAMLEALAAPGVDDSQRQTRLDQLRQRYPAPAAAAPEPAPVAETPQYPTRRDGKARPGVNDLERHLAIFKDYRPFAGFVPKGFLVDFVGGLTDANFRSMWGVDPDQVGGGEVTTSLPEVSWGEGFFEAVDWFEAAREARGGYTMVTLGACYGSQAVGAYLALRALNPMPCRLVAVEAEPANFEWLKKHLSDNGIDPQQHWLINCALSDTNKPVLFPIGEAGSGVNNCFSTNNERSREIYADSFRDHPNLPDVVHSLILEGKTGIEITPVPGAQFRTAVEFVSAVTLNDVLGPLDAVDLLESDIQQSEIVVFPPAMDMIQAKVKRVHLGTHGAEVHARLLQDFVDRGFEIVFDYPPNSDYETPWGSFSINDGVITARNSRLLPPRP